MNGERLRVNTNSNVNKLTVAYTTGWQQLRSDSGRNINRLYQANIQRVMSNWSPALDFCLLALGKIEAMFNYDNELYDNLAGKLIAREAGARLTDLKGKKLASDRENIFLASNGARIHNHLVKVFEK